MIRHFHDIRPMQKAFIHENWAARQWTHIHHITPAQPNSSPTYTTIISHSLFLWHGILPGCLFHSNPMTRGPAHSGDVPDTERRENNLELAPISPTRCKSLSSSPGVSALDTRANYQSCQISLFAVAHPIPSSPTLHLIPLCPTMHVHQQQNVIIGIWAYIEFHKWLCIAKLVYTHARNHSQLRRVGAREVVRRSRQTTERLLPHTHHTSTSNSTNTRHHTHTLRRLAHTACGCCHRTFRNQAKTHVGVRQFDRENERIGGGDRGGCIGARKHPH